jgi:hypothetical protein
LDSRTFFRKNGSKKDSKRKKAAKEKTDFFGEV